MKFSITTKKHSTKFLFMLISAAALSACGGGSGGNDSAELNGSAAVAEAQQNDQSSEDGDLVVGSPADGDSGSDDSAAVESGSELAESSDPADPVLAATSTSSSGAALVERFDSSTKTSFGTAVINHKHVDLVSGQGVNGSKAIRVKYVGYEHGSERVIVNHKLPKSKVYTLNFDVKFCSGFDFAKGGKLHGLGPYKPVAGGNSVTSTGWSAKGMFNGDGAIQSYIYSQNMRSQYGDVSRAKTFRFQPGRYYAVTYQVGVNDPVSYSNGYMRIYIDGVQVVNHTGIKFRSSSLDAGLIQTLMFNTFHGGNDSSWAPRNADGSYKTDCAYYDNFAAYPYARVRTALGS